jgi:predicted nucleotidyltransferase
VRAALLAGSAARGDADVYSDIDLILFADELPSEEVRDEIRVAVDGGDPRRRSDEGFCVDTYEIEGVPAQVAWFTVARREERIDELLGDIELFDSELQKVLSGLLEALPLYGPDMIERWRARVRTYPEEMRHAVIERHWKFFPLWYYADAVAARDAELWRLDALLEAAFNLLHVLAALNRVYFTRFEFKRMRTFAPKLALAPPRLIDRLESLFRLDAVAAAAELGRLVEETRALVASELPELELRLEFPPAERQRPWRIPASPPSPPGGTPPLARGR